MKKVVIVILVVAALMLLAFGLYYNFKSEELETPKIEKLY